MSKTLLNGLCPLFIFLFSICSTCSSYGQDTVSLRKERLRNTVITDRPPQAVFAELGGAGLLISFNYDARFNKTADGLGWRLGLGYSFSDAPAFITIPVGLNYLVGNNGKYFEVGAGATYLGITNHSGVDDLSIGGRDINKNRDGLLFGTITLGYRRQPVRGGFNFRAGITPLFGEGGPGITAYVSFGFNF